MARPFSIGAWLLLVLLPRQSAQAGEILRVDPVEGPYYTIQSAIDASGSGDVVELVPYTYRESVVLDGRILTIRSTDGPATTVWDGGDRHRLILATDSRLTIEGIAFEHGKTWTGGGGAVRVRDGRLTIRDCVFRENRGAGTGGVEWMLGGAVYVSGGESMVDVRETLFVENSVTGANSHAPAIALTIFDSGAGPAKRPGEPVSPSPTGSMAISGCTFLRNVSSWTDSCVLDMVSDVLRLSGCLFVDNRWAGGDRMGDEVYVTGGADYSCCLFWRGSSPEFDERTSTAASESPGSFIADPRLCVDDQESVHESSPALHTTGCGRIGNLPVGCVGPLILAVRGAVVDPVEAQTIRLYGYGLDGVDGARLESSGGEVEASRRVDHDGAWMSVTFDLLGAAPGPRTIRLLEGTETLAELADSVTVRPVSILAFRDPWVQPGGRRSLRLAQRGGSADLGLELVHSDTGERIPILGVRQTAPDTLVVDVDLEGSPEGLYDLWVTAGTTSFPVEDVLYLGTPPVLRVPDDYETISAAVEAAPAGAQIHLADGIYGESVTVDRPLWITGEGWNTRITPGEADARCVHVSSSAGRITRLEKLNLRQAAISDGPGCGVWAEVPVSMRDCDVYGNQAGAGNGGGAWLAPGSQVVDCRFSHNSAAPYSVSVQDPFVAEAGVAGGLFCLECRVEGCEFESNYAGCIGGAAVSGVFRNNHISNNSARSYGGIDALALRGTITRNRVENSCGSSVPPNVCIFGPSSVSYNTFSDYWWDLCEELSLVQLQGPIDFFQNTLAGTGLAVCTHCQVPLGPDDKIRIYNNLIDSGGATYPYIEYCEHRLEPGPVFSVPLANLEYGCNLGSHITVFTPAGRFDCPDCVFPVHDLGYCEVPYTDGYWSYGEFNLRLRSNSPALPDHSPIGCVDTLGAQPAPCDFLPVLISGARVERTGEGVELSWALSPDLSVVGLRLFRDHEDRRSELTAEPLEPCRECRYLDRDALGLAGPIEYWLSVIASDGGETLVPLGGLSLPDPGKMFLSAPHPNPAEASTHLSFYLPRRSYTRVELVDVGGRVVMPVAEGWFDAGLSHLALEREVERLDSGVYWVRLSADGLSRVQRLIVVR
jgi:hypothetical protein